VPGLPDAEALPRIIAESAVPIIADIHFNASLAIRAMDAGVAAVRINPGNIGGEDKVREVVAKAQETSTPLRIGANSGSLPEHLKWTATSDPIGALVKAAMEEVELLEQLGFHDFKISVKSTSVPVMIGAYRMLAGLVPYPLHLGVTEAGTLVTGAVKSAIGIGTLLEEGIGDTIRVSLSARPRPAPHGPRDDLVPLLWPHQRRGPRAGRDRRDAAARLQGALRGGRDGLCGERSGRGRRRRLRHRRWA
jgi:(E)-4-hydroxy-3-methylbut-2-enyl-diphosphate synthase